MGNIVTASFQFGNHFITPPVFQYNIGMILRFKNVELPETYRVDFSNSLHGESKSMIGGADGVEIPYEYFVPGERIYAWIVLSDNEGSVITEYQAEIPVDPRAKPTEEVPTPSQQSVIDQTIAALNDGVERAEAAVEQVGDVVNTALQEAKDSGEFDGFSPIVTVTDIEQGHAVTITDANGEQTFDVLNGQTGEKGTDGRDGSDGTTFIPHVSDNGDLSWANDDGKPNPQTVNIKGPQGERGEQGPKGETGTEGPQGAVFTPTVSAEGIISWSNNGNLPNPQSTNIKGPQGEQGAKGDTGATGSQGPKGDTGADGCSPIATVSKAGNTVTISITDKNGTTTAQVSDGNEGPQGPQGVQGPAGTNGTNGINGVDGISPTVTVTDITGGHRVTITDATGPHSFDVMNGDAADAPVQDVRVNGASILDAQGIANVPMASATAPGVVVSGTVQVSGTTPTINGVDGVRYVCGEVATITINPPARGCIDVIFESGSTATVLTVPNTVKWPEWFNPENLEANATYELNILDGVYGAVGVWM